MLTATQSIREIVTSEPLAATVLERFEIDLCSEADVQLENVCAELQLSVEQVLEKLADAESRANCAIAPDLERYSLTRLVQHIVRTHHQTVRQELPQFAELSQRIAENTATRPHTSGPWQHSFSSFVLRCLLILRKRSRCSSPILFAWRRLRKIVRLSRPRVSSPWRSQSQ